MIIYIISIIISKAGLNIATGLILLGFLLNIKEYIKKIEEMSKEYKMVSLFLLLYPFYDFFTPGGLKSVGKELSDLYRIVPLILVPISLKDKINFKVVSEIIVGVFCLSSIYIIITNNFSDRLRGFSTYTITAHVASLIVVYIFGLVMVEKNRNKLIYLSLNILIGLYLISLTATRGALIGVFIGITVISILKFKLKSLLILAIILSIMCLFVSKVSYLNNFEPKKIKSEYSLNTRFEMWKVSFKYNKKESYFFYSGVGRDRLSEGFLEEIKRNNVTKIQEKFAGNPHNMYVLIFSEKGIYMFLIFIYVFIYRLFRKTLGLKGNYLYYSIFGSEIVYFISGLTEDNWRSLQMRAPYFMILILIFLSGNQIKETISDKKNLEENLIK